MEPPVPGLKNVNRVRVFDDSVTVFVTTARNRHGELRSWADSLPFSQGLQSGDYSNPGAVSDGMRD